MQVTGTFLDEISHDIPHQNWGEKEWDKDFEAMKSVGIDTVIMIRCGYQKWLTYDSKVLIQQEKCFSPPIDYVALFLRLSEKHGMNFYFGLYDSGKYWVSGKYKREADLNRAIADEVWQKYGPSPAFKGWYISHEINHLIPGVVDTYVKVGQHCKTISDLPVLISPYIDGTKAVPASASSLVKENGAPITQYESEWNEVFDGIKDAVDIVAFQDGHVDFEVVEDYLHVNKQLAEKYDIQCWSNCESFDRDMPIKFLPIKWEKMLMKLQAAQKVGVEKVITFEFSHFMSPNSSYIQAHHLFNRYKEYFGMDEDELTQLLQKENQGQL
ncbi:MAG: DUF4434 domain-containing protein [Cyclobacteriaceae bacterium]|nr:DUF4434 domain-containing protein [Cyclobacteriaceae bacterium HetDA_MAG_MS6]